MSVMVTLKDGSEVPQLALIATTTNLEEVIRQNPFAFFDLVEKCKDANYKFTRSLGWDTTELLKDLALLDKDERVHDIVKQIVLNSVEGEEGSLRLANPLQSKNVEKL